MDHPNSPSSKILYLEWQPAYLAVLVELDPKALVERVTAAETAKPASDVNTRQSTWRINALSSTTNTDFGTGVDSKVNADNAASFRCEKQP
jgi:hypothetical protein